MGPSGEKDMTDRWNALLVILDHDIRDDDAEPLRQAILRMRGVADVRPNIVDVSSAIAEARAVDGLGRHIVNAIQNWRRP